MCGLNEKKDVNNHVKRHGSCGQLLKHVWAKTKYAKGPLWKSKAYMTLKQDAICGG